MTTKKTAKKTATKKHAPVTKPAKAKRSMREVAIDEARERVGASLEAFHLGTSEGTDALAEELGEEFVQNVTGADDAAAENRDAQAEEENGGPFVYTTGKTEFADDIDETNPLEATREALPTVSNARPN